MNFWVTLYFGNLVSSIFIHCLRFSPKIGFPPFERGLIFKCDFLIIINFDHLKFRLPPTKMFSNVTEPAKLTRKFIFCTTHNRALIFYGCTFQFTLNETPGYEMQWCSPRWLFKARTKSFVTNVCRGNEIEIVEKSDIVVVSLTSPTTSFCTKVLLLLNQLRKLEESINIQKAFFLPASTFHSLRVLVQVPYLPSP